MITFSLVIQIALVGSGYMSTLAESMQVELCITLRARSQWSALTIGQASGLGRVWAGFLWPGLRGQALLDRVLVVLRCDDLWDAHRAGLPVHTMLMQSCKNDAGWWRRQVMALGTM